MKKNKTTFIMVLFFFMGLIVLFYPSISNYTNQKIQSKAISKYEEILKNVKEVDYSKYFKDAEEYNKKLSNLNYPLVNYKKLGKTDEILKINDSGMLGYITIDKIKVELPIYYGTDAKILNTAVGILEGTSFPVGGIGTHSVLSAHRGLPSSKLFTNLDQLELEDTFVIKVLDRTMTYEVDQILIVEPDKLDSLEISKDKEYVTLMTCTPYGINTHRMLVRGHRVENARIKSYVSNDAFKLNRLIVTPIACIPILIVWLISIAFKPIEKNIDYKMMFVYPTKYMEEIAKKKALKEKIRLELIEKKKNKNIKKGK